MTNQKLRWGILGSASIAKRAVVPGILESETGEVVAIASRNEEHAKLFAETFDIPTTYGSYERLLADDTIDAVYIPLPNHLHKPWTIRAAEAGKHVLCEKPLALNADEAQEMVDACENANVLLAEAFMYRYHPRYERMKAIIASGEIGDIRGIHGVFTFNNANDTNNVRYQRSMGGGSIYDVGCYPINAARFILGTEPEAVTVQAFHSPDHDHVDMMASGLIEFPHHAALTFDCGMWAASRNKLEILGTEGRIEVPYAFLGDADFTVITKNEVRQETFPSMNPYALQADSFGRSVLEGERVRFEPEDSIKNMQVIDACLQSAADRVRIEL